MIIRTLLWAQLIEIRRNSMLFMMPITPFFMAFFFRVLGGEGAESAPMLLSLTLMMSLFMVGWQLPSLGLGEEKEKRTLESLLLTPARPSQIILARGLAVAVFGLLTGVGILLVFQQAVNSWLVFLGAYLFGLLFTISGGMFVGLMMPDMRSASMIGTFSMLILAFSGFPPLQEAFPTYWKVAAFLPSRPIQELIGLGINGHAEELWQHVLVLAAYSLLALALCIHRMRKQVSLR